MIERDYPRDSKLCKVKMFSAWLRGDRDVTFGKLARALTAVGKRNIAEAMCTERGMIVCLCSGTIEQYYSNHVGPVGVGI